MDIDRVLGRIWTAYICLGFVLFAMSPKMDDSTVLHMTATGKGCNYRAGMILAWPLYMKEFKLDGLRPCDTGR
jgi:hypothetical protein